MTTRETKSPPVPPDEAGGWLDRGPDWWRGLKYYLTGVVVFCLLPLSPAFLVAGIYLLVTHL